MSTPGPASVSFRGEGPRLFSAQLDHMMRAGGGLKQWYLAAVDELDATERGAGGFGSTGQRALT